MSRAFILSAPARNLSCWVFVPATAIDAKSRTAPAAAVRIGRSLKRRGLNIVWKNRAVISLRESSTKLKPAYLRNLSFRIRSRADESPKPHTGKTTITSTNFRQVRLRLCNNFQVVQIGGPRSGGHNVTATQRTRSRHVSAAFTDKYSSISTDTPMIGGVTDNRFRDNDSGQFNFDCRLVRT